MLSASATATLSFKKRQTIPLSHSSTEPMTEEYLKQLNVIAYKVWQK
jgi:hypothetical protein